MKTELCVNAILIAWSIEDHCYLATAVTGDLSAAIGATTIHGVTATDALGALLEKRWCVDDETFRPTPIVVQTAQADRA